MTSRKHSRSSDEDEVCGKRIKLDNLFNDLNLEDEPFVINPQVNINVKQLYDDDKQDSTVKTTNFAPDLNSYIAEKLMNHFSNVISSNAQLTPWYNPKRLVVYRFQKWIVRMFNQFLRKYNNFYGTNIRPVGYYDKVIRLATENGLSQQALFNIILEENAHDMKQREAKRHSDKHVEEGEFYKDVTYDYWDRLKFEIVDSNISEPQTGSYADEDVDMGTTEEGKSIESNYGSYYYDYSSTMELG